MATRSLLAIETDAKTIKGRQYGVLTGILYLAPADSVDDGHNVCPFATPGCKAACLNTAGRGIFTSVQTARANKRHWFFDDRPGFLATLHRDIARLVARAKRQGLKPAVRLNGTTDIAWELLAPELFAAFPKVRFYDYTKIPARMRRYLDGRFPANYSLTFSRAETNDPAAVDTLVRGGTVAIVFDTKRGAPLPTTWHGYPVTDGDRSDLRFRDKPRHVIGLRAKGRAKHDASGFVVTTHNEEEPTP